MSLNISISDGSNILDNIKFYQSKIDLIDSNLEICFQKLKKKLKLSTIIKNKVESLGIKATITIIDEGRFTIDSDNIIDSVKVEIINAEAKYELLKTELELLNLEIKQHKAELDLLNFLLSIGYTEGDIKKKIINVNNEIKKVEARIRKLMPGILFVEDDLKKKSSHLDKIMNEDFEKKIKNKTDIINNLKNKLDIAIEELIIAENKVKIADNELIISKNNFEASGIALDKAKNDFSNIKSSDKKCKKEARIIIDEAKKLFSTNKKNYEDLKKNANKSLSIYNKVKKTIETLQNKIITISVDMDITIQNNNKNLLTE
jgi:hypothetical protein